MKNDTLNFFFLLLLLFLKFCHVCFKRNIYQYKNLVYYSFFFFVIKNKISGSSHSNFFSKVAFLHLYYFQLFNNSKTSCEVVQFLVKFHAKLTSFLKFNSVTIRFQRFWPHTCQKYRIVQKTSQSCCKLPIFCVM